MVELVINLMRSPANVCKGESIGKVRFKKCIYIYGHHHRSLYPARANNKNRITITVVG